MEQGIQDLCDQLGHLHDEASRKAFLSQAPQLLQLHIVEKLAEAVRVSVRVDVPKALTLAEAALIIAGELENDEALARGLRAKANALWFMGDCRSAVDLFERAAVLFEQIGKMDEVGRTLSSSIQSLTLLGEYDQAFAVAARARDIFTALGEAWRVARLEINVANIYHRQNRFVDALPAYERAYRELLPYKDMEGVGVALHNMAVCLIALDDYPEALKTYERVREFCRQHEMPLLMAQADYNIAGLHYLRGDYTKALEILRSAREICRKNEDTYHLGLCDLDQSEIYLELRLVAEAFEMAHDSFEHFQKLGMGYESVRSLTNLAIAVNLQGDSSRALKLFAQAKEIISGENNQVWAYLIDLYQALVLADRNEFSEACSFCTAASDFFRSAHIPSKYVLCLLLLTRIYLRTGEVEEAARHCQEALHVLETLDSPTLFYQAQYLQGRIYEALGRPEQAYDAYKTSRDALEALRSSLQKEELKIGFMRNRLEVYEHMIQLCLNRGECSAEETFLHVEAAKSRTLRDLMIGGPQLGKDEFQESQTDRQARELRKELNWYYHRIEREQLSQTGLSAQQAQILVSQAKERERELLRVLLEAPPSASVGAALRHSSTATMAQIRAALGSDMALIEYFSIDEKVYAAVVTHETVKFICVALSEDIAHSFRLLKFQLSKSHLNSNYRERFGETLLKSVHSHLRALYEKLIAPLRSLLSAQDLVIVPYGPLHALPFHALFDGQRYLIDQFRICYAPSASIFAHPHVRPEVCGMSSLILGVDDPKTPFIREEVEAVAAVAPEPQVLFGPEATEQALREKGYSSRLIHIASHGLFRQDSPMFSAIRLADSYVNLYDLYRMNLPVELLTLSGCVTGMNVVEEGDELLGLTRGLLYAGARSLLLSLWDVDDRSTSEFMKEFYFQLQTKQRKIDAHQAATVKMRERYPHPYHWAPFKMIGRTSAL
ncbi:MAG: CHAT domain-containing protein [Acidobacteriaceae bacterium]|nr:CHAT domain-containing protein [Acidobacteriaceae bacterium]